MRKVFAPFVFLSLCITSAFLLQSCNKLNLAQSITWSGNDVTITIPIISDTSYHGKQGAGGFTFNLDSLIKAKTGNAFSMSNIDTVTLDSCVVTLDNADSANNFANFLTCDLSISSNLDSTFSQVAEVENIPDAYAATLTIPVNKSVNLKDYMYSASVSPASVTFNYQLGAKLRRATTKALTTKASLAYYFSLKL